MAGRRRPLFYVVIGGFRTTAQINAEPVGLPDPWVLAELHDGADLGGLLAAGLGNSALIAVVATALAVAVGVDGGLRPVPLHVQGS